jgi:RNA polymerase sigma factor (sigma-70 family)
VAQQEAPGLLLSQLARLPERQRLVLFLRYFADLPYDAIADALEISPGTVAATLNAAHQSLRRWLEEVESNEP